MFIMTNTKKTKKSCINKYHQKNDKSTSRCHNFPSSRPTRSRIWSMWTILLGIVSCHYFGLAFASSSDDHISPTSLPQQSQEQFKKRATMIVDEMSKSNKSDKDDGSPQEQYLPNLFLNQNHVPKDCWIDTVEILEQAVFEDSSPAAANWLSFQESDGSMTMDPVYTYTYHHHHNHDHKDNPARQSANLSFSSSAANFCSSLDVTQKQAMALGLTKCHFYSSGLAFHIPSECTVDQVSTGRDKHAIQSCLTELDKTAFLVYSQFFTHTEMMCIKLTEDVRMYRKEEVLDRYEKKFQWMDEKLEQFELLENKALQRFEHSATVMDRFEATAKIMDEKILDIQRIENVTKDLGENIERTVSMTISSAMKESTMVFLQQVYGQQEIQWMRVIVATLKQNGWLGWHTFYMWIRFCLIFLFVCLPTFVFHRKLGSCRRFVCMGSILELTLEHVCHYLVAVGTISRYECDGFISWMRSNDWVLYLLAMMMSFIRWTIFGDSTYNSERRNFSESISDTTMLIQMNQVLDELKTRFELEQNQIHNHLENLSRRGQKVEQQMLALSESTPRPFEHYHVRSQKTPEDRIFHREQDDSSSRKINQLSFSSRSASALISPWSPIKQQSSSLVNRDTLVVPNESFDYYRTPTSQQARFNEKSQPSSIIAEVMTPPQGIMAIHSRYQSHKEDHHSNPYDSPLASYTSSSLVKESDSTITSASTLHITPHNMHEHNTRYHEKEEDNEDSFDDCRSHNSCDTCVVEMSRGQDPNYEEEQDDVNLGKRKRKSASQSLPKKRQK